MSKPFLSKTAFASLIYCLLAILDTPDLHAQVPENIRSFVTFAGPNGTGTSLIGSSITINNGTVGAYKLVQTTGNATINSNIYSGDKVIITNSNVINGRIAAGNSSGSTGNILTIGSSTYISGNIDVNGNINIGGGTVLGTVTLPVGRSYVGPVPAGDTVFGTPSIPVLPAMPAAAVYPTAPAGYAINSYTTTQKLAPGWYGSINYSGNKTLTLDGPGVYVFNSFQWSGNSNKLVFDFKNSAGGLFFIYVINNADFGKLNASLSNGGSASRIFLETHGNGVGTSIPGYSLIIANGSSGGGSKWQGTVYATNAGINIGSGTGSSNLTGALLSATQVTIQSGVTLDFAAFVDCIPPVVKVTSDRPLNFLGQTTLTDSVNSSSLTHLWQASNGGVITSDPTLPTITVGAAGTYTLKVSNSDACFSTASVVVSAAVANKIGAELLSIYQNYGTTSLSALREFFLLSGDSVMIDVIVNEGYYNSTLTLLQTAPYGLRPPYGLPEVVVNGQSGFIITGNYPIVNLLKLNFLVNEINYVRPHYQAYSNSGLVISAGDTSMRSHFVRSGYDVEGRNIKIGVISDSYKTITTGTTPTLPLQPVKIPPYLPLSPGGDTVLTPNPIPQTFKTNTAAQDTVRTNGDLPGSPGNFDGHTIPVHVLKDFAERRTDEGRAMLQIIHDVAPSAELYFRTGLYTAGDFAKGIKELKDAGCNIIVDDITYITEPFLKDGVVAKTVDTVVGQGVTYVSAAGNFEKRSYEKDFNSYDINFPGLAATKAHNFGTAASPDLFQHVRLAPGSYIFVFQWADNIYSTGETVGTNNDLDIFLTPNTDGTGLIGYNRDNSDGDPIEFIPITISGTDSVDYNIFIVNNTPGTNPSRIKYIGFRGGLSIKEYNEGASTLVGQGNALGAIAVGASRFNHIPGHPQLPNNLSYITKPKIESFSSVGGTYVYGVQRQKPDLVGPDGVNTTVKMGQDYPDWGLDGYSNFFGTSCAAPHVAAAAALLMEGRKKFITGHPATTLPAEIKSLFKTTAVDMRPTGLVGYDFSSGSGLINVDAAMRTFAAPKPFQIELVVPEEIIPGDEQFTLIVTGQNFSTNSVIYIDDSAITTQYISPTELRAVIGAFEGNPEIRAFTPPMTAFADGGYSNSLYFFDADIRVQAVNLTKKYGQIMPVFDTLVYINDTLIQNTTHTLAELGLDKDSLKIVCSATTNSDVGTYGIKVFRNFDPTKPADSILLRKYNYEFIDGTLTIDPLPLTIAAQNATITYGEQVPNVQFTYTIDPTNIPNSGALLNQIRTSHQSQLAKDAQGNDVFGLVNGVAKTIVNGVAKTIVNGDQVYFVNGVAKTIVNGVEQTVVNAQSLTITNGAVTNTGVNPLTSSQTQNLSFYATTSSLDDVRQLSTRKLVNGSYVPATTTVVDLTQESILDFNINAAQTQMLSAVSNTDAKGLVDAESFLSGVAKTIVNGVAKTIVNGQDILIFNGQNVAVFNNEAYIMVNGQRVPIASSHERDAVIVSEAEIGTGTISPLKSLNVLSGLDAGLQSIMPGGFNNGNYAITNIPGILTVNKASLQVKADNKSRLFGEPNPTFTVSYSGFVMNDNLQTSGITGAPAFTTTATATSPVSPPTYPIIPTLGTLSSTNYSFTFANGALTVLNNECVLTHSEFKNFGNTSASPTSLWFNMTTKVSGQLSNPGDYLLFKHGFITFKSINSNPLVVSYGLPDGRIEVTNDPALTSPQTHFDATNNIWITYVPVNFASTSDIFVTGAIINSSNGFIKLGGNTSSIVKGKFYSNKTFKDQWAYAMAAYQKPPTYDYVTYNELGQPGDIVSINGDYRAGTPLPILQYLVQGASGGGGNNYTGSKSAFDNYTACVSSSAPTQSTPVTTTMMEVQGGQVVKPGYVQVIPNPATDHITLSFVPENTGNSKIVISAFDGRRVMEINNGIAEAGKQYLKKINVSNLASGIYVVQIINSGKIKTEKIVIRR